MCHVTTFIFSFISSSPLIGGDVESGVSLIFALPAFFCFFAVDSCVKACALEKRFLRKLPTRKIYFLLRFALFCGEVCFDFLGNLYNTLTQKESAVQAIFSFRQALSSLMLAHFLIKKCATQKRGGDFLVKDFPSGPASAFLNDVM